MNNKTPFYFEISDDRGVINKGIILAEDINQAKEDLNLRVSKEQDPFYASQYDNANVTVYQTLIAGVEARLNT